jgi:regulatory protein
LRYFIDLRNEATKEKIFSKAQCKTKAESYCAYQERAQYEVRNKLYEWGLHQQEVEEIIAELIESNFLNEERFALAYTLGKFRIKGWGKDKIRQGLKLKRVPDKMITKCLQQIDYDDYTSRLRLLIEKKAATTKESDPYKLNYLLSRFARSRGYEQELISEALKMDK